TLGAMPLWTRSAASRTPAPSASAVTTITSADSRGSLATSAQPASCSTRVRIAGTSRTTPARRTADTTSVHRRERAATAPMIYAGDGASGLSSLIKDHLAGGASRLAALLLPQILPVSSVVAPCQAGAALRDLILVQRGQATRVRRDTERGRWRRRSLVVHPR